ncbi:MAG: UPF0158 family protein [Myxococcota bacterium]
MDELMDAFERDPNEPLKTHLNVATGAVLTVSTDWDDEEGSQGRQMEELESHPDRFEEVPHLEGYEEYRWMTEFAEGLPDRDVAEQLLEALQGKGAFSRFRSALREYPDLKDQWFSHRRERLLQVVVEWLETLGIDPQYTLKYVPTAAPAPRPAAPPRITLMDALLLGAPDGKTELIGGLVRRYVPARNKPRAVFTGLCRDLCDLHGLGWRKSFIAGKTRYAVEGYEIIEHADHVEILVRVRPEIWRAFQGG